VTVRLEALNHRDSKRALLCGTCICMTAASTLARLVLSLGPVAAFQFGIVPGCSRRQLGVKLCATDEPLDKPLDSSGLYASLQKRRSQLSSRSDATKRERELIAALDEDWPAHERAQNELWNHWFSEEGEEAMEALKAADGNDSALKELMEAHPDWAEPANRLATLRYMEGDFEESITLCLRVLRAKPWHFGALSGIVMCYAKLSEEANVLRRGDLVAEANRWAKEAMPQPGPRRKEWVQNMVTKLDAKLTGLSDIAGGDKV